MKHVVPLPTVEVGDPNIAEEGQWYWHKGRKRDKWLGCVWTIGSNYVELRSPQGGKYNSHSSERVHFDDFHKLLTYEPDANRIIASNVAAHQANLRALLEEIRELAARLGFENVKAIGAPSEDPGTALAVISTARDPKRYRKQLEVFKKTTLPELQEKIAVESGELNRWLLAGTMGMKIEQRRLLASLSSIDERIFNINLYAGLTEEVKQIAEGKPASQNEKLRVLQRRLYMDEECLLNYQAGGMTFKNIGEFDKWIAKKVNRNRILPWPRCLVAMRVRRNQKEREARTISEAFINFELGKLDELTFLYIRNGDQLWRLNTAEDFGEMLFPDRALYESGRPMMMKVDYRKVDAFMATSEWKVLEERYIKGKAAHDKWAKAHPKDWFDNPHRGYDYDRNGYGHFDPSDWEPFNPSSVFFDDGTAKVTAEIKAYNRIVLILQGLLDRSQTLHPHPPINLWNGDHMTQHVELVRDGGTGVLHGGEKPDFHAYQTMLNASIDKHSILIGQQDYWQELMAERENERDGMRSRGRSMPWKRYQPYGNPGPEEPGKPVSAGPKFATFRWKKQRLRYSWRNKGDIGSSVRVPLNRLLNVSAYKPGDYKQFFNDWRTRQEYLQWAPLLLAAEDHLAGKTSRKEDEE